MKLLLTPRRQPQCGVYLLFILLTSIINRFGECHPPKTARIVADGSLGGVIYLIHILIQQLLLDTFLLL